jgi:ribosomal protein L37AE/L43A
VEDCPYCDSEDTVQTPPDGWHCNSCGKDFGVGDLTRWGSVHEDEQEERDEDYCKGCFHFWVGRMGTPEEKITDCTLGLDPQTCDARYDEGDRADEERDRRI